MSARDKIAAGTSNLAARMIESQEDDVLAAPVDFSTLKKEPVLTAVVLTPADGTAAAPAAAPSPPPSPTPDEQPVLTPHPPAPATPRPAPPRMADIPLHRLVTRRATVLTSEQKKIDISMPADLYARFAAYEDAVLERFGDPVIRATVVHEMLQQMPSTFGRMSKWLPTEETMSGPRGTLDTRVARELKTDLRKRHGVWKRERPGLTMNDVAVAAFASFLDALETSLATASENS